MTEPDLSKFHAAIAKRKADKQLRLDRENAKAHSYDEDLIPDSQYESSPEDTEIDRVLANVDIVDAYRRWCGKMAPAVRPGQKEGIMVSCPIPGHRDNNPSAWLNREKNTWFCATCQRGGDKYDIAAWKFNYDVPGYKVGASFHELRRDMVKDMGYVVQRSSGPSIPDHIYLPEPVSEPTPAPVHEEAKPTNVIPIRDIQAVVTPEVADQDLVDELVELEIIYPSFDWREINTPGTFIDTYMGCVTQDDAAEEYHFWNALVAIGLAAGKDISLSDGDPVFGNLLLCILGNTGARKSRSLRPFRQLLHEALPFDMTTGMSEGVKVVSGAASGEVLIQEFTQVILAPAGSKLPPMPGAPVRGIAIYGELSDLTGRAARAGNIIKSTIMDFSDNNKIVSTTSVTHGRREARDAFFSAVTTTQPESLKDLIGEGDTTSGFLNRWIFASGKAKKKESIIRTVIDISPAIMPLQRINGSLPRVIGWTEQAEKVWDEHFHHGVEPLKAGNPILGRLDLLEKKLILLLAINEELEDVTEDIVRKVIKMHSYLVASYGLTTANLKSDSVNNQIYRDIVRQIQRLTQKDPWGPTKKNVRDMLASKKYDKVQLDRIFDLIARDDNIEVTQGNPKVTRGRKSDHFRWVS